MSAPTLHTWRWSRDLRWPLVGALMPLSVLTGVVGQSLLTGFPSFFVLTGSALLLAGLAAYLLVDFQGELQVLPRDLVLPGGEKIPRHRVRRVRVEDGGRGADLVIELALPTEERRVATGQPRRVVEAFAAGLPLAA